MHPSLRRLRRGTALGALSVACCPVHVAAQSTSSLPPAVVTAARLPQQADSVLADVSVIEAADIERAGPVPLIELLRTHGGVEITSNGGAGQVSGVFLRGSNPNHVVVLVDGVRINSATTGANAFEHIPLAQIERIEILRGPASSLYGADAIGGVIQIFTRRAGSYAQARASAGTWHTAELSGGIGREFGTTRISVNAGYSDSDGFSATNETHPFSFNPDDDGYRNRNAGLHASHAWRTGHELALRALYSDGRAQFDNGPGSDDVNRQRLSSIALESSDRWTAAWRSLLRLARSADHLDTSGSFPGEFDTDQDQFTWQNDIAAFAGRIAAGLEWRREEVGGSTAYTTTRRNIASAFGGYAGEFDAHQLQASLRVDDNSQFGTHTTGNLAYGYRLTPAWRVSAGAGTAFKAPSFNDLYFPPSFGFAGNPNLEPERSRSAEAALRYQQGHWSAGATVFENRIDDLIAIDPSFTTVINVDRARIRGLTLGADYGDSTWRARIEWTHQDPVDLATGNQLVRRARNHANASAGVVLGPWRGDVEWVVSSERYGTVANTPESRMGGYGLVNLRAAYAISPQWSLAARLNNATDKRYELVQGYNTAERALFVTLEYAAR
jgi:vitamin B12 transporter